MELSITIVTTRMKTSPSMSKESPQSTNCTQKLCVFSHEQLFVQNRLANTEFFNKWNRAINNISFLRLH